MLTLKYLYVRPNFENAAEAAEWDKLQKFVQTVKQFHDDFDHIVLHKDLYRTFYYYYLQEIRFRIIEIITDFTTVEWREPKPDATDPYALPSSAPAKGKDQHIPDHGIRVKGYKEKFPLECCDEQFRTLATLRLHYHAVHEKSYLMASNTCEMKASILRMCVFRHALDEFVRSGMKANSALSFYLTKILRKIISIIRY